MKLKISLFFQSPFNVFLFRHMSPRIAQRYLHGIGFLYYVLNRKEKRIIERNVREVLAGQDGRVRPEGRQERSRASSRIISRRCSARSWIATR